MIYRKPKQFYKAFKALEARQESLWLRKHFYASLYKINKGDKRWNSNDPNHHRFLQFLYCVLNLS